MSDLARRLKDQEDRHQRRVMRLAWTAVVVLMILGGVLYACPVHP